MEVLTKILQQGTEFDTLAETVLADRFEQLVQLVTMISDKGELPIAMALANVVTGSQNVSVNLLRGLKKTPVIKNICLNKVRLSIWHNMVSQCCQTNEV